MKWIKRTAALLAPLLLILTIVQAEGPSRPRLEKERPEEARPSYSETEAYELLPELPVIAPERPVTALEPSETVPEPSANTPELYVITPEAETAEPDGPRFPEGEDWQLLLVNPWNEMPEDYKVQLKALPDGNKVDEKAYDDLTAMLQACRKAGLAPKIVSSYRTMSKQTYLYNNKIARLRSAGYSKAAAVKEAGRWVARPGTSEHQLGLALDIVSSSYQALTKKQEQTKEQKWLMEHCWEYGFILRYPNDKSEITGIGYEPWHYRYVGVDIALDVRDSGLCFEEYIALRNETLAATNG